MLQEIIFSVTESLDGGFEAKAIGHSIYSQCDDYSELADILRDAVKCHFDESDRPAIIRVHFVKDEIITV